MKKILLIASLLVGVSTSWGQYCLPTYGNACTSGDYIDAFTIDTYSNPGTGCGAPGVNNFTDNTALGPVVTVQQSLSYNVTCAPGPTWGQYFAVWIDFNQDGDFDELNEFFDIGYSAAGANVSNSILIPTGVLGGNTQMRVLCHFGTGVINQPDACIAQSWGEVEDYIITIGSPPAYEAATLSIDAPATGCGLGMETVMATFQNNGALTADTFVVCYSVNAGPWLCDTATGLALATGATYQHSFLDLLDLSTPGDYYIDVAVSYLGDTTNNNDTISGFLVQSIPTVSGLPYFENFESGTGGWTSSGTLSNWEHGVVNTANLFGNGGCAPGDSLVWATGLTTPYNSNATAYLESPCIDFTSVAVDPLMTFDHLFQVEGTFEDHYVEVSTDGGASWTLLGATGTGLNWYNQPANWDGVSYTTPGGWRKAGHVLTGTAGQSDVRIRFVLTSDGSVQQDGIAIDNINIEGTVPLIDVIPLSMATPISGCGLTSTEVVTGSFLNIGTDTLIGFDVCYSVNGGAFNCETIGDTIFPGIGYQHTFAATADFSVVGMYTITMVITAGDLDACNDTVSFTVQNKPVINTFPYLETFENGQGGWDANNTINGSWAFGTPAKNVITGAASGVNAWVTGGLGLDLYNVNENSWIESPCFDFTALDTGSWVAMKVWWESENSWDGANLQISLDTAATWTNLGAFGDPNNWYNDNSISGAPGGSQEGWTGDVNNVGSAGWVTAKLPLDTALVGEPHVLFRVAFGSDGSVTRDGFAFDNFAIGVPPTVNIGADFIGCANYEITPGLVGTYEWFAEDTTATPTSTLISTEPTGVFTNTFVNDTTYYGIVVFTDSLGLCASDTVLLTLSPAPYDVLMDTTICYDDSVQYNVGSNPNYTYIWSNGSTVDSSVYVYTVGGPVSVIVTDTLSGCASTATATIFQTPAVDILDVAACEGDTVWLDATSNYATYAWSNGDSLSTTAITLGGLYTVTTTDLIGCVSSASATVTINALPTPAITGSTDTLCVAYTLVLDAGSGFTGYAWSTGGTSQTESILGSSLSLGANTVTVSVTDANGCVNTDDVSIFVDACAGIEELGFNFVIYPNPSEAIFNYEIDGDFSSTTMTLTSVLGQVLWNQSMTSIEGQIDLGAFAPGTYYLKLTNGDKSSTLVLVKK
jgi:hypothetical protein